MADQSLTNLVNGIVDATKPIAKLVAITEGAIIEAVTEEKDVVPNMCEAVDKIYDELKK
jgi:hypothetical protein